MSFAPTQERLELPKSLQKQLREYRHRVWSIKLIEATCAAIFAIVAAFLALFVLDRFVDTPGWSRVGLFALAMLGFALIPLAIYRWVWRNRRPDQLARLLGRKQPNMGDQLLGVIELVDNDLEQARSRALCEAAIAQVADDASKRNFADAVPNPKHLQWLGIGGVFAAAAVALLFYFHDAAANTWVRLAMPWCAIPRYTFANVKPLPERLVVAHGEPFSIDALLAEKSVWKPASGTVQLGSHTMINGRLVDGRYVFAIPPQIDPVSVQVHIGDFLQRVHIVPTNRPELTSIVADVTLPDYLGRPGTQRKDVRGGSISLVRGSKASFSATASRALHTSQIDSKAVRPSGSTASIDVAVVNASSKMEFRWEDEFGLAGKAPFNLNILARDDEAPSLTCEDLPRQKVILDSETLPFKVRAQDDFGVKRVGFEWQGVYDPVAKSPATGERILAAGGFDKELVQATGTFSAKTLGIEPQQINVRVFVEDYFPGRGRVYSPSYTFFILNAEQHAIWLTEQLSKWHRQSLEVRDREMQLFETNKQLRALPSDELDQPETRRKIENQAAAERANGRRLTNLVASGEDLVRQASRNPEFGVGHLEKWAEMLQILKDISGNRMPSVSDLLKQAAQAPTAVANTPSNKGPMAGQTRAPGAGQGGNAEEPQPKKPPTAVPTVSDGESSMLMADKKKAQESESTNKSKDPMLRLPQTTLLGGGSKKADDSETPAAQKVDDAVRKQQDLLAEFEKIAEELNRVLASLEGSTLVKRLKAASRVQTGVAGRLSDHLADTFGVAQGRAQGKSGKMIEEMSTQESKGSHDVSLIMDDLQAYYERRQYMQFKTVLDDMRKQDVIGGLRQLGDDVKKENGVSMAQCEFWSDTLDRWAEDLVDPTSSGKCPGCKSKGSLPPSIVLEVLQILEAEVNLREETRVAQQARGALTSVDYEKQARKLADVQKELQDRTEKVNQRIHEIPDSENDFAYEMNLLAKVADVMGEAEEILAKPETGNPAIAAETEAIELLLKSKRINPKGGGGGGGSTPGGGGGGTTQDSALALLGTGINQKEVREDHAISQSTGESGPTLPEEFRAGLDEYFNRLERRPAGR